jgi:hypothetical protein
MCQSSPSSPASLTSLVFLRVLRVLIGIFGIHHAKNFVDRYERRAASDLRKQATHPDDEPTFSGRGQPSFGVFSSGFPTARLPSAFELEGVGVWAALPAPFGRSQMTSPAPDAGKDEPPPRRGTYVLREGTTASASRRSRWYIHTSQTSAGAAGSNRIAQSPRRARVGHSIQSGVSHRSDELRAPAEHGGRQCVADLGGRLESPRAVIGKGPGEPEVERHPTRLARLGSDRRGRPTCSATCSSPAAAPR